MVLSEALGLCLGFATDRHPIPSAQETTVNLAGLALHTPTNIESAR